MKRFFFQCTALLTLVALLGNSIPMVSAATQKQTKPSIPAPQPANPGLGQSSSEPSSRQPATEKTQNQTSETQTSLPQQPEIVIVINEDEINNTLAQYNLSVDQIQQNLNQLKNLLQLFQSVASDGVIDQQELLTLIAALTAFNQSSQLDDFLKKLFTALREAATENNLDNSASSRALAKNLLLAASKALQTYAQTLITLVPNSQIPAAESEILLTKLAAIQTSYQESWNRVSAVNTADPASAPILKNEFETMYWNTSKNAYWQMTARPVMGATQTLMALPTLRQVLPALQKLNENVGKIVNAIIEKTGYADPAMANVLGANYLIGTPSQSGRASEHLAKAEADSQSVVYQNAAAYPFLSTVFAANNMYNAALMLKDALQFRPNDETLGVGGERGLEAGRREDTGLGRKEDKKQDKRGVLPDVKNKKTEKRSRRR